MSKIVQDSGTGFAFPSQTLYLGRDDGLDSELGKAASREVELWRKTGKLPFPRLSADRIQQLQDTLDYPLAAPRCPFLPHSY
jgi:MscS family membrane protein